MLQDFERAAVNARSAEVAERWDDMAAYMKERCEAQGHLGTEDRDLLATAYKNALDPRRRAVRIAAAVAERANGEMNWTNEELAKGYRTKVEAELFEMCEELVDMLQTKLIPVAERGEAKVFYLKLKGDAYRYQAEAAKQDADKRNKTTESATNAYKEAGEEAKAHLLDTHPLRLDLALNYAVFQHEVLHDREAALATAKNALYGAKKDLISLPDEAQRDTEDTCFCLQENVTTWEGEMEDEKRAKLQREQCAESVDEQAVES